MSKLCQKCHKNPAVVHFRAYGQDGRHSTISYCLPCAIKMASDEETPSEMRQMLQGMMKDLRDDFPAELAELQEQGGFSAEELFSDNSEEKDVPRRRRRRGSSDVKPKVSSKSICPFCHRDIGKSMHSDGTARKCGHCLTSVRDVICEHNALDLYNSRRNSAEAIGLPIFCKKRVDQDSADESSGSSDGQRLLALLGRYHAAVSAGNLDGAELLKEELNCLRRNLTEEMRRYAASHASAKDVSDFLKLPQLVTYELRDEFWRYGWLPLEGGKTGTQIRLSSSILFYRTIVDWPMSKDASGEDYHRRLAEFLWQDPIFEGGKWIAEDKSLCSANHRLVIDCGNSGYCQSRSFSFDGQMFGKPGENGTLMTHLCAFLRRLECRCTFFTDPELGFYSPHREALGSCIYPVEYLHLPALCMTEGIQRIQRAVRGMDKSGCSDDMPTIFLMTSEGVPDYADANHENPIPLLAIVDARACGTPLRERVMNLNNVAKFLEKEELQARRRLKSNVLRHREIEDLVARSLSLLRNARLIGQSESILAVSRVWLGIELGCISTITKSELFHAMRTALLLDSDFHNPLFRRKYKREDVSVAKGVDYSIPKLDDLDQLGEVLWEDQDSDIALPEASETSAFPEDLEGLKELLGNIGNPMELVEKLRDVFEQHLPHRESLEETTARSRCNDSRAFFLRDILAKRRDEDDLFWGGR